MAPPLDFLLEFGWLLEVEAYVLFLALVGLPDRELIPGRNSVELICNF